MVLRCQWARSYIQFVWCHINTFWSYVGSIYRLFHHNNAQKMYVGIWYVAMHWIRIGYILGCVSSNFSNSGGIVVIGNVVGYISSAVKECISLVKRFVISQIHLYMATILIAVWGLYIYRAVIPNAHCNIYILTENHVITPLFGVLLLF